MCLQSLLYYCFFVILVNFIVTHVDDLSLVIDHSTELSTNSTVLPNRTVVASSSEMRSSAICTNSFYSSISTSRTIGGGDHDPHPRGAMTPTPTFMGHCLQEKIEIL